jgi:uncharacterized membrane protein HdeD (DUF308 family)
MKLSLLFRNWWVILMQGILMIVLSIIIFNNPDTVLASIAFWLGLMVTIAGIVGIIAWLANAKEDRDFLSLLGSLGILIIGILMVSKMVVTMKAITLVFGLLVAIIGLVLVIGSWDGKNKWSLWWVVALLGASAFIIGIKSILDVNSGAENISTLIGVSVLLSGIGLVCMALLKKIMTKVVEKKATAFRSQVNRGNTN